MSILNEILALIIFDRQIKICTMVLIFWPDFERRTKRIRRAQQKGISLSKRIRILLFVLLEIAFQN